jgi:hypothetical protein
MHVGNAFLLRLLFFKKATMKRIRKKSNYEENERNIEYEKKNNYEENERNIEYEKKSSYEENERNIELLKSPTRPPLTIWVQN